MNKIFNYSLFFILLSFIFINSVNAECSYKERKQLLNEANAVDISVEPVLNDNNEYDFKFTFVNLSSNFFVKYYNTNNGVENIINYELTDKGTFSFIDDNTYTAYDYKFEFYSTNDNCYADKINSRSITKPKYNLYSENVNCTFDENKDFKYCAKFLNKNENITLEEFYSKMLDYNNEKQTAYVDDTKESFFKKYYIYIILPIIVVIAIVILLVIKKQRSEKL